jgi:hypothetical protein
MPWDCALLELIKDLFSDDFIDIFFGFFNHGKPPQV